MAARVARLDGRYELVAQRGGTARAATWQARDVRVGRDVSITILLPEAAADPSIERRFTEGATMAAGVTHPNLVTILDVGEAKGVPFVVTEPVQGPTAADLGRVLGTLAAPAAVYLVGMAAHALGAAHRAGMTHGRIAPTTLATGKNGVVVQVTGLGIDAVVDDGVDARTGVRVSTLPFGPPEQLRGRPILPSADVYALGAVLYRLLVGRAPWSPGPAGLLAGRLTRAPRPPSSLRPDMPADLEAIVLRALEVDPVDRFADGEAFAAALGAWTPESIGATAAAVPVDGDAQPVRARGAAGLLKAAAAVRPAAVPGGAAVPSDTVVWGGAAVPRDAVARSSAAVPGDSADPGGAAAPGAEAVPGPSSSDAVTRRRLVLGAALWLAAMVILGLVGFGILGPARPSGSVPGTPAATAAATTEPAR